MLCTLLLVAVALAGQTSASILDAGTTLNRFMVTYAPVPTFEKMSFYSMPRNWEEAGKMGFFKVEDRTYEDRTELWCRMNDYRVCVIMDKMGSAAGIQLSVSVKDMQSSPMDVANSPEWRRTQLLGEDVFSAAAFFISKDALVDGRKDLWSAEGLTVPDGIYIQQSDAAGKETGRLHVPADEAAAEGLGFHQQACFVGMGKHFFQGLTKESTCEAARPYFMLYNKKTKKLQGFGFTVYGKTSVQNRKWFEHPPAVAAKMIAPDSPSCMTQWIEDYGMFTMHVFFVEHPWLSHC